MAGTEIAAYNMETDISKLEAPTFTTIERNQSAAMLALNWDHQVNLVGKKVLNPMIHCCDKCLKPILIYGRMIPCKHVFCLGCARQDEKQCPRCKDKVNRVEQAGLGSIFLCTQGGSRYGNTGCRRTYLSSRDLHAHVAHRHVKGKDEEKVIDKKEVNSSDAIRNAVNSLNKASLAAAVAAANSATAYSSNSMNAPSSTPSSSNIGGSTYSSAGSTPQSTSVPYNAAAQSQFRGAANAASTNHISVINTRQSNLITVPIHGSGGSEGAPPPVHPGYVPGSYPAYTAYPTQPTAAPPPASVTYTQGAPQTYSQPPPTYAYPGNYAPAPPPAAPSQYSAGPPPAAAPYAGSAGPAPGYVAPPTGFTGTGASPYQGQWTRPPPGGARPPAGANHRNYYRR